METKTNVKNDDTQSRSTAGLGTGQFRLRACRDFILVIGVSGNARQRRKIYRRWQRHGKDPVRFYMNAAVGA